LQQYVIIEMNKKNFLFILFSLYFFPGFNQEKDDTLSFHFIKPTILDASSIIETEGSDEIKVISASRSTKYISDLPLSIYVITHEEILLNGYTTLCDALKKLPGIRISKPGTGEYGEGFQLRGLPGNQYTKILVNNLPIKPSVVAGMPIGSQIPIRQAERIEIIYGPAAAVYGADAVTGVINIVLKEADRGTFVRGDIFVGEGNYNYTNFTIGGKAGKNRNILEYSFYGNKSEYPIINNFLGHEQAYNPLAGLQHTGNKINLDGNFFNPLDITPELLYSYGISEQEFKSQYYGISYKGTLTVPDFEDMGSADHMIGCNIKFRGIGLTYSNMYRKNHSSMGLSPVKFRYDNPQNYWAEKIQQFTLSYSHDFRKFSTTTNLLFLSYFMDNTSSMGLTRLASDRAYLYSQSHDMLFEQLFTLIPSTNSEIIIGGAYQASDNLPLTSFMEKPFERSWYNVTESSIPSHPLMGKFGFNPMSFHNISAFAQGFSVYNRFHFLAGLRFDANSLYGSSLNPRIALLYKLNSNFSISTSAGLAFKVPPTSITYRSMAYLPHNESDRIKYIAIPAPSLKPERYQSVEIGFQAKFSSRVTANISIFYNEITNPIVNKSVPIDLERYPLATGATDSLWATTYINAADAISRLYGLQANILISNIIPKYKVNGELNLSLARQSDEAPELVEFITSNMQLMPRHIGQFRISAKPHKSFYFRADMVWMSKWLRMLIPFEELYSKIFSDVDGFFTIDLSANIILDRNLMLTIKGINILDEKYGGFGATGLENEMLYNPQLGRNFRVGLSYMFN